MLLVHSHDQHYWLVLTGMNFLAAVPALPGATTHFELKQGSAAKPKAKGKAKAEAKAKGGSASAHHQQMPRVGRYDADLQRLGMVVVWMCCTFTGLVCYVSLWGEPGHPSETVGSAKTVVTT